MESELAPPAALLIVDVQYDFLPGGLLAVKDGDKVLPIVQNMLKGKWSFVVASQDYHPAGHVSFASTHSKEAFTQIDVPYPYGKDDGPATISQMLWPDHCVQGTRGTEIEETVLEALQPWLASDKGLIIQKGTDRAVDAYSAFASTPGPGVPAGSTRLAAALRAHGVATIFVVGLATDYCVRASALDARSAGFAVRVIREGVRAVGGEDATRSVEREWTEVGVEVVSVDDECVKRWL
ncbi:hypothetical protein M0805_006017 [Coniferiporia weirii]|nr:hypothetical protein M0805_006017 [Coniferiporia weirii]